MNSIKKRVILIHHHIFKNAGTSFNYALKQAFSRGFQEYDLPNSKVVTSENLNIFIKENPWLMTISGHHICLPPPQGRNYSTISSIILRNPLDRIYSIYKFERMQNAETEGAIMAKKLNFKDFVAWRLDTSSHVFCNYQTLYCSRTTNLEPKYQLTVDDLNVALMNLDNCLAVGTVARYEEFLLMAQFKLRQFFPQIVLHNVHLNISEKKYSKKYLSESQDFLYSALGSEIASEVEQLNELDSRLYSYADRQLDKLMTEVDIEKLSHV